MVDTNFNAEVNGTEIIVETIPLHSCQIHSNQETFSVRFTWKKGSKYRSYLLVVFVVTNPYVSPSEIALG